MEQEMAGTPVPAILVNPNKTNPRPAASGQSVNLRTSRARGIRGGIGQSMADGRW